MICTRHGKNLTDHVSPPSTGSWTCWLLAILINKVKSCYNKLRLGTVIALVSSGIDFVNTPRLYSDRATR